MGKKHLTIYDKIGYNIYNDRGINFFITIMFYYNVVGLFLADYRAEVQTSTFAQGCSFSCGFTGNISCLKDLRGLIAALRGCLLILIYDMML